MMGLHWGCLYTTCYSTPIRPSMAGALHVGLPFIKQESSRELLWEGGLSRSNAQSSIQYAVRVVIAWRFDAHDLEPGSSHSQPVDRRGSCQFAGTTGLIWRASGPHPQCEINIIPGFGSKVYFSMWSNVNGMCLAARYTCYVASILILLQTAINQPSAASIFAY